MNLECMTSTASMDHDQTITETLFFAITFTPPRLDNDFLNTFKFHYDKPNYHFLRLVRISRPINTNHAVESYILVCDSQEIRSDLKNRYISQSLFDDGSLKKSRVNSRANFPISLLRSTRQYVIDQLCDNLGCLKNNLEVAVRSPESVRSSWSKG